MEPASIRTKNPGAIWGSALAKKWGSTATIKLNDGLGQGNNIAVFPTFVQGICAQLDLWRTSPNYRNKRFADAIAVWAGHNNVPSYIAFVKAKCPGITENTIMDDDFWRGPLGIAFLKAQAWHEAGQRFPAPDGDWVQAQRIVMMGPPAVTNKPKAAATTAIIVATGTGAVVQQSVAAGHSDLTVVFFAIAGAILFVGALWFFLKKKDT